ncbi:hypothetical protein [Arthrobacter caoxuetaonis]|uniref:Uncharacterized protein n=1 Tax=Arthrobacter caoxuetaonis TaxID=2886935 RepID=A0A9X1MGS4_9MICC|nr:hypothetical protein [Arthrobacter caoxuetaonis]MCC3299799.1 hypothetical protein [Arthrobacter caoxuetaonis]USQ59301.1 hypothetical protein NF551_17095 [Arthrobacter caoxuetaonis]
MSNVIDFRNRQPQGIPAGGQFAATAHGEASGVSLGRHAEPARKIPEKLLMGAVPDPKAAENLQWQVQMASDYGNPEHYLENFAAAVPNLPRGEAEELFFMALDSQDGEGVKGFCETAAERNTQLHPGGTVSPGYIPPNSKIEPGYQQGILQTGEKYTGYRDAAYVAKDIRADLKAATAGNYLPKDLTYSVRIDKFSGGQSIDVTVQGLADADRLDPDSYDLVYRRYDERPEAKELRKRVEEITNAYNRSDTDAQSDYFNVSYYSHVRLEDDRSREYREAEAEKRRLKRQLAKSA